MAALGGGEGRRARIEEPPPSRDPPAVAAPLLLGPGRAAAARPAGRSAWRVNLVAGCQPGPGRAEPRGGGAAGVAAAGAPGVCGWRGVSSRGAGEPGRARSEVGPGDSLRAAATC